MAHRDPPIRHHDHQVPQAQLEARVPTHAQNDDLSVEVPSFEQIFDPDEPLHILSIARHPRVCTRAVNTAFKSVVKVAPDGTMTRWRRCRSCGTRHSQHEPIRNHSTRRSLTDFPVGLSLHQSPLKQAVEPQRAAIAIRRWILRSAAQKADYRHAAARISGVSPRRKRTDGPVAFRFSLPWSGYLLFDNFTAKVG